MKKNLVSIVLLVGLLSGSNARSQTAVHEPYLDGYMLGTTLRQLNTGDVRILDVPFIDARTNLGSEALQFKYGGHLMWGVTDFFVDWTYAGGLHYYPFGRSLSVNATGHLGTFLLDNFTYMGSVGTNVDFPLDDHATLTLGAEFFYRNSRDLLDYVSFPKHSGTGEESINIDGYGIGASIGLRF